MLIILTLIVTWIVNNWWKLLLLLVGVIALREYQVKKHKGDDKPEEIYLLEDKGAPADAAEPLAEDRPEDRL